MFDKKYVLYLPITSILVASNYFGESCSCGLHLWRSEPHLWPLDIPEWAAFMSVRQPILLWCFYVMKESKLWIMFYVTCYVSPPPFTITFLWPPTIIPEWDAPLHFCARIRWMFKTGNFGQQCFTNLVSGGASVLTFWSLTVYLCVNVYDRTRRSRHSKSCRANYVFMCICNYVVNYVYGLTQLYITTFYLLC